MPSLPPGVAFADSGRNARIRQWRSTATASVVSGHGLAVALEQLAARTPVPVA
jgi:hypothetical protein